MNSPQSWTVNPPAPAFDRSPRSVSGPSGLSDHALSPLGMPLALLRDEVRVAFLGRTSTEDQQDPRQSILRQLGSSKTALPESWVIVAHFYDVESGRMELERRGRGEDYDRFDIPIARDGGISDLLEEAARPDRRFDVVICESIARVARRAYEGLSVERDLERCEVSLFAANETISVSGSRAQRILQRRINQSVAEYEVLNTLEQSWGGLCTHVREGWNIGKPCYGYKAKTFRHPNPAKAAKGFTKSRLEPDGPCGQTVTQIASWAYYDSLGTDSIADLLNQDLVKFPPPMPPGKVRARGSWCSSSVNDILRNPKYTGYQVYNRRATRSRRGKVNDPVKWVWSLEPAHEPLVPKWMYDELMDRRKAKRRSRADSGPNSHPQTRRTYAFRGMIFCPCGRRMVGDPRHGRAYYLCRPSNNNRGRPDKYAGHPKTLYLREDAILDAVAAFFADRVFGPDRKGIIEAQLAGVDDHEAAEAEAQRQRLRQAMDDLAKKQESVMRQAMDGDPEDAFTKALRSRYNDLEAQRAELAVTLSGVDETASSGPRLPTADDLSLLDGLPYLALNLAQAPEALLRTLFEVVQLHVQIHDGGEHATLTITLPADQVSEVAGTAERISDQMNPQATPGQSAGAACGVLERAPGEIRTHTGRVLNPLPLPVGLRGRDATTLRDHRSRRVTGAVSVAPATTW
ncbi:putative recombinase [Amycolatopsis sp. NBRC 101858]|nr:putative recombinase [Amycolatopsis sp. NBRC 101858]